MTYRKLKKIDLATYVTKVDLPICKYHDFRVNTDLDILTFMDILFVLTHDREEYRHIKFTTKKIKMTEMKMFLGIY